MKLFETDYWKYEAVKFPEENLILITCNEYVYYIYDLEYKRWEKHEKAGFDHISVHKYQNVTKSEIMDAMSGIMPTKETDFMRLCKESQLNLGNVLDLLKEDYPDYMNDRAIYHIVFDFLERSGILHKSYLRLKELFDNAQSLKQDQEHIIDRIKELCFEIIGKDIFKSEIRIVDGHDGSSFFWIMPVRVIDYSDTNNLDSVAEMASVEVSIEEDDVYRYLTPFLNQYFDDDLKANRMRVDSYWADDDVSYVSGFEWNLTHNFFTFDSMTNIIRDINDTIEALLSGKENAYSVELKEKTDVELIVDFYRRFVFRIKYMMQVGKENGYDLISFMGP